MTDQQQTSDQPEPCPECGSADAEYLPHEPGCPSGYPTREAPVDPDDATASHPDHDGLRAAQLDGWHCDHCDAERAAEAHAVVASIAGLSVAQLDAASGLARIRREAMGAIAQRDSGAVFLVEDADTIYAVCGRHLAEYGPAVVQSVVGRGGPCMDCDAD